MRNNAKTMVLASFAGDALALGAHWIYDPARIANEFGRTTAYADPPPGSFHPTKRAGDFTHYGDQTLILLESIAEAGEFQLDTFARRWQDLFANYTGYRDHATKETLERFEAQFPPTESGSASTDLGGASRIAPLVYAHANQPDRLVEAAKAQTAMTHNHPRVIEAAAFFAVAAAETLAGQSPRQALVNALDTTDASPTLRQWHQAGLNSADQETVAAIGKFGRMCDITAAFPSVIHLIARHGNNLTEALVENTMAGGDSAARGLIVGMLFGAHAGMEAIPKDWIDRLKQRETMEGLLGKIDRT